MATAAARAPSAVGKARRKASPAVSTSTPPDAVHAERTTVRWVARAVAYRSSPSWSRRRVEPSMSLNRKVTVPVGRSVDMREDDAPAATSRHLRAGASVEVPALRLFAFDDFERGLVSR